MKRSVYWLSLLPMLLPLPAVHAQNGFGRLFNTPDERRALDAGRGKARTSAPAAGALLVAGTSAGNTGTADPALAAAPAPASTAGASAVLSDLPPGTPPELQSVMQPGISPAPPATGAMAAPAIPRGAASGDGPPPAPPPPEQLTMNGVLRGSNGRSTVWFNNVPQRGDASRFSNRNSKAVTVTLPSGKRVVLQPGQRYDLADGRVKDINQP